MTLILFLKTFNGKSLSENSPSQDYANPDRLLWLAWQSSTRHKWYIASYWQFKQTTEPTKNLTPYINL